MRALILAASLMMMAAPLAGQDADYAALLARSQAGDTTVDAGALRMAFTRTDAYVPYSTDFSELRDSAFVLFRDGETAAALARIDEALALWYVDIGTHVVASRIHEALGHDDAAAFHAGMAERLVESIFASGDGSREDAPLHVIDVSEEYAFLRMNGLEPRGQSLGRCKGAPCDILRAEDDEGNEYTLYFDVSLPFGSMRGAFAPEESPKGSKHP